MNWSLEGIITSLVFFAGLFLFMPWGLGACILGWVLFMFPGLVCIFLIDDIFMKIIGLGLFMTGAILTYKDIKEQKEKEARKCSGAKNTLKDSDIGKLG